MAAAALWHIPELGQPAHWHPQELFPFLASLISFTVIRVTTVNTTSATDIGPIFSDIKLNISITSIKASQP